MVLKTLPLAEVPVGSIINCIKIKVPNDVLEIIPGVRLGSDSTRIFAGTKVKKLAVVLKVESDHLVVTVISTLSSMATTIKNPADWYPLEPAQAINGKEPLPVNNQNIASYVLLRRLSYFPDDPDNNVLVSDSTLPAASLALLEGAIPANVIPGE